jgi:Zn-dependent M28 family amino/carboxypeptidase
VVVLVAHFDTKSGIPGFVGANDSGSGVGLLLELARVLAASPPGPVEVRFAVLDGEESQVAYGANDGLHGSRRLAARARNEGWAPRVRAVVVFDMVGDRDLTVEIPRNSTPRLVAAVFDAARAAGVRDRFRWGRTETLDDHVPFIEAGMPAVDVIDFSYGSAPGLNDYWHTPQDTLDKISPASLEIVGRSAIEFLRKAPSGWPE